MKNDITIGSYRYFWFQLVTLMMSVYLLTDMISGFFVINLGIDIKASLIYKTPLFLLVLILVAKFNVAMLNLLLLLVVVFFSGPLYQFYHHGNLSFFIIDFSSAIKIITPVSIFLLYKEWYARYPLLALKSSHTILKSSFYILSLNFIIGLLGFGKSTYSNVEGGEIGTTGLIFAGNELSGAFIISFTYMLHMFWNYQSRKSYCALALFTIFCGFNLATKTAILASLMVVFLVPIVNERHELYKMTLLKAKILWPVLLLGLIFAVLIVELLQSIGLYNRLVFMYRNNDLLTMILSGRNEMVAEVMAIITQDSNLFEQMFGQGIAISLKRTQGAITEVDSVDLFSLYGIFAFIFIFSFYLYSFLKAHKQVITTKNFFSPFVLLASFILLILSQLSGHIWSSGTIGILMGVMLGSLYARKGAV